jgi:hypothetical protein
MPAVLRTEYGHRRIRGDETDGRSAEKERKRASWGQVRAPAIGLHVVQAFLQDDVGPDTESSIASSCD